MGSARWRCAAGLVRVWTGGPANPERAFLGLTGEARQRLGACVSTPKKVFVDAVPEGTVLLPGRPFAFVESTAAKLVLESPLSGEVTAAPGDVDGVLVELEATDAEAELARLDPDNGG